MLGWTVLSNLKLDPRTRHIPVQMLSVEEERQHGLSHGALRYVVKPADHRRARGLARSSEDLPRAAQHKRLLVIVGRRSRKRAASISSCSPTTNIEIVAVATGPARRWPPCGDGSVRLRRPVE